MAVAQKAAGFKRSRGGGSAKASVDPPQLCPAPGFL
jgi:hypothetical protein